MQRADRAEHLVSGMSVTGYGWYDFELTHPLFTPDGTTDKLRVEIRNRRIVRIEGGTLTETGRVFYEALANLDLFQVWTDRPNKRIRFQVIEDWRNATFNQKARAIRQVESVLAAIFEGIEFGDDAPARH